MNPVATGNLQGNISSRCSSNSEAGSSVLLEHIEEMFSVLHA